MKDPPSLNMTASVKWVVQRRGGGEYKDFRLAPIVESLPASSLAPQDPARGSVIPTAVLVVPVLSGKRSHSHRSSRNEAVRPHFCLRRSHTFLPAQSQGNTPAWASAIPTAASAASSSSLGSLHEANTLAVGGISHRSTCSHCSQVLSWLRSWHLFPIMSSIPTAALTVLTPSHSFSGRIPCERITGELTKLWQCIRSCRWIVNRRARSPLW